MMILSSLCSKMLLFLEVRFLPTRLTNLSLNLLARSLPRNQLSDQPRIHLGLPYLGNSIYPGMLEKLPASPGKLNIDSKTRLSSTGTASNANWILF